MLVFWYFLKGVDKFILNILFMTIYNRIYNQMTNLIKSGQWKIGEQIPSENFLKRHYKVSRLTIRKALDLLTNENLIIKKKGSRAKVISRKSAPKTYIYTTLDEPMFKKKTKSIVVYFAKKRSIVSKRFLNENVFEIKRHFFDNKEPAYIQNGQVLEKIVPDLSEKDFNFQKYSNASLSEILVSKYNLKIYSQKITSNAMLLDKEEAGFFKVPINSAATKWVNFYYDINDHLLFVNTEISLKNIYIELYNRNLL